MAAEVQFGLEKSGYKKEEVKLYIGMLQDGIQNLDSENALCQQKIQDLENKLEFAEESESHTRQQILSECQEKVANLEKQMEFVNTEKEDTLKRLDECQIKIQSLKKQASSATMEKEQAQKSLEELQEKVQLMEKQVESLCKDKEQSLSALNEERQKAELYRKGLDEYKREQTGQIQILEKKIEAAENELKIAREKESSVRQQVIDECREEMQMLEQKAESASMEQRHALKQLQEENEIASELRQTIEGLKKEQKEWMDEKSILQQERGGLLDELVHLRMRTNTSEERKQNMEAGDMASIFIQAENGAKAYLEEQKAEAQKQAQAIIEEARRYQLQGVDKIKEELEQEKEEFEKERENLLLDAQAEAECARVSAQHMREEASLILRQAEEKSDRMLRRSEEKALKKRKLIQEDLEKAQKQLVDTVRRYSELYEYLDSDSEISAKRVESFLEDQKLEMSE